MSETETPIVHVIAQARWHAPAFVVGNRAGLLALREALNCALDGAPARAAVFALDGEGFGLHVRCLAGDDLADMPYGYTDEAAQTGKRWPRWMRVAG